MFVFGPIGETRLERDEGTERYGGWFLEVDRRLLTQGSAAEPSFDNSVRARLRSRYLRVAVPAPFIALQRASDSVRREERGRLAWSSQRVTA